MKILQINCTYKQGSTGKIVCDIHTDLIQKGVQSVVCYGRNGKVDEENVYKTCSDFYAKCNNLRSRFTGLMYGGCFLSTNKLISIIKKENPDVVHLHCINGYFVNIYRLITWLKNNKIKTLLTLHAELMHTANCGYALDCDNWKTGCGNCPRLRRETNSLFLDRTATSWKKMKKAFDGFDTLIVASVSPWLTERAQQSPILAERNHCVVLNGLDTDIFRYTDTEELKREMGLEGKKVVFHASPAFNNDPEHIKGGYYLLKTAQAMLGEDVVFVVAGPHPEDLEVPANVMLLGRVADQRLLARYYAMADVTLLTSKKETFSMITAETLCCGTPLVGFKAGAPERIAIPEYTVFVEHADTAALVRALQEMLARPVDKQQIADVAQQRYSKKKMSESYYALYQKLIEQ